MLVAYILNFVDLDKGICQLSKQVLRCQYLCGLT